MACDRCVTVCNVMPTPNYKSKIERLIEKKNKSEKKIKINRVHYF